MKGESRLFCGMDHFTQLIGVQHYDRFQHLTITDGTDMMLERLDELGGIVRHLTNPSVFNKRTEHHRQATRYTSTHLRV
jgi:hypothetical protein